MPNTGIMELANIDKKRKASGNGNLSSLIIFFFSYHASQPYTSSMITSIAASPFLWPTFTILV